MKCEVCDARLVNGECPECREISQALGALRDEALPALAVRVPRRGRVVYPWVGAAAGVGAAAAAAAVLMLALPYLRHTRPPPSVRIPQSPVASMPMTAQPPGQPLKIKILTPDPSVVIYWISNPKEGE
ncbi:MAG TPA: hypothetical protein VGN17_27490 [Bryobacteraceae bacterium]|jgi:hypothetical protein